MKLFLDFELCDECNSFITELSSEDSLHFEDESAETGTYYGWNVNELVAGTYYIGVVSYDNTGYPNNYVEVIIDHSVDMDENNIIHDLDENFVLEGEEISYFSIYMEKPLRKLKIKSISSKIREVFSLTLPEKK